MGWAFLSLDGRRGANSVLKADFIAILAEYGNPSTATIYRLMEYGKKLMASQAIEQIHNYFVKTKP